MFELIKKIDNNVFKGLNGLAKKSPILNSFAKVLAAWPVYLIPVTLVIYWFWTPRWRLAEIRAVMAGLIAWQVINKIIQHFVERSRPINDSKISDLLFKRPNDSFPSNHAAFGMAVFLVLWLAGERSLSWVVFGLTIIFSVFRVVTGLHFPSDIVVGWFVGVGAAALVYLLTGSIDRYIGKPLLNLAKLFKLV